MTTMLTKKFFTTDKRIIFCKGIWDTLGDILFINFFLTKQFDTKQVLITTKPKRILMPFNDNY